MNPPGRMHASLFRVNKNLITLFKTDISDARKSENPVKISFAHCFREMIPAGSVNGIVCLSYNNRTAASTHFVVLWNPAINQWKPIRVPSPKLADAWTSVGLGYDSVANDFKIIRLVSVFTRPSHFWVEIYSANQDAWIDVSYRAKQMPFWTRTSTCSFIVKGIPFWTVTLDRFPCINTRVLGTVDPCTGLCKQVRYPSCVNNRSIGARAVNLMDSVASLVYSRFGGSNEKIDVYVLDEGFTSWTKKYTTGLIPFRVREIQMFQCFNDIGGEIIVVWQVDGSTAFYDPKTGGLLPTMGINDLVPTWSDSYSHVESLIRINGMELIRKDD